MKQLNASLAQFFGPKPQRKAAASRYRSWTLDLEGCTGIYPTKREPLADQAYEVSQGRKAVGPYGSTRSYPK